MIVFRLLTFPTNPLQKKKTKKNSCNNALYFNYLFFPLEVCYF